MLVDWLSLPSDLLQLILSEWVDLENVAHLDSALCSFNTRSSFLDILCGQHFVHTATESYELKDYFEWLKLRRIRVKQVDLAGCQNISNSILKVLTSASKLSFLSIRKAAAVALCLLNYSIEVECLIITGDVFLEGDFCEFFDSDLENLLKSLTGIQSLDLGSCNELSDDSCDLIVKYVPDLISFVAPRSEEISPAGIRSILTGCTKLTKIVLCSVESTMNLIATHTTKMTHIELTYAFDGCETDLVKIAGSGNLKHLEVTWCSHLNELSLTRVSELSRNLTTLALYQCGDITDKVMQSIALHLVHLKQLVVAYYESNLNVSDSGVCAVATACKSLDTLHIIGSADISDASVECVAANCASMANIIMTKQDHSTKITEKSVQLLVNKCTKLASFDFTGAEIDINVGLIPALLAGANSVQFRGDAEESGVVEIENNRRHGRLVRISFSDLYFDAQFIDSIMLIGPQLLSLFFDQCDRLTDSILTEILSHCLNLTTLSVINNGLLQISAVVIESITENCSSLHTIELHKISHLDDDALIALFVSKPDLTSLSLSRCSGVSDITLLHLATHCPNLLELDIAYNHDVTDNAVCMIIRKCSRLKSLNVKGCMRITKAVLGHIIQYSSTLRKLNLIECNAIDTMHVTAFLMQYHRLSLLEYDEETRNENYW